MNIKKAKNWVENEIDVAVQSMKRLPGSTSSILYEVTTDNSTLVLRQFDNMEWLSEEPDLVQHESTSLKHASANGLPAPLLIAFDEAGKASGLPSVLMTKVEGKVEILPDDFNKWTDGLAEILAKIHRITADDFPWVYESYTNRDEIEIPEWTKKPDKWQAAFDRLKAETPAFKETFIHRDFHPTNVLWLDGEVTGVVDWPNACRGPVGIDVGHCRVNLALLYSVEIADLFLTAYEKHAGSTFTYNSYWDIVSAFDILEGPPTVYSGWATFGVTGLTDAMMEERLDAFVESLVFMG
ncbi:aminoglycoside phosphotransferase family protein [Sporosarcina sp. ANT_H38]|uniref:aminoglycoside phosphotransferase family protein n=1 Tax=Sporosarcina sp. ANT_H38 TaxID=2597358 RepID=UPI0011F196A3|nr:aminoglycoside phosphotransferase family protein [Sporosarcina sp. ANT_H38]KAA0948566.1 aminoglycoside phosphotransferase family protein [Sporosarcina sp. ANT_H38]